VLLVRVGSQEFAFAAQRVDQVAHLAAVHVESVGTQQVVRIDGRRLPLADLAQLLAVPSEPDEDRRLVVISSSGRTVALLVDSVLGQSQVLQRPVGLFMAGNTLLEAVVITAAQNAVLLLSADRIVDMTEARRTALPQPRASTAHHSILVVDDSEVTRELVASILRNEGFEVVEAVNGRDALDRLRANRPAVVLSDLEMPLLDGIGLLAEIRRSAEFADLPFIILTTRGSDSDRRRGAEAGASAYLVKGSFDENELLGTVRRFLHQGVP
jgi:two-component system chemotaxis sensor kinase CheA